MSGPLSAGKLTREDRLWSAKRSSPLQMTELFIPSGYKSPRFSAAVMCFLRRSTNQRPIAQASGSAMSRIVPPDPKARLMTAIGCTGFSSPVVYDLDGDGVDEAIISVNDFDCSLGFTGQSPREMENRLSAINFKKRTIQTIDQQKGFKNIFSTPWIGDLDDDGYLDLIHCPYSDYW